MFAAQRLVSWAPARAKECLRALADSADHPAERRVVGLASLAARDERIFIKKLLDGYEENQFLLKAMEKRDFRPFDVAPDFASDSVVAVGGD